MTISKFCIKHKVTTLLAVILILVFGVVFTTQLQMSLLPNMSYPAAYVYCYYNGAGPSDMEELVTRPLESAIMSVSGVDEVQSSSADSVTTVQILYVDGTDVDIAAAKLRGVRFGRPEKELPPEFGQVLRRWEQGELSGRKAALLLHVTHNTFLKWARNEN